MLTKIILNRKNELANKGTCINFFIDDEELAGVANGSPEEYFVTPGTHKLQCKINWCSSAVLNLQINDGEIKFLKVKSRMKYYSIGYILFLAVLFSGPLLNMTDITRPVYFKWVLLILALPSCLYFLYYFTICKNKYLLLEEDTESIFN